MGIHVRNFIQSISLKPGIELVLIQYSVNIYHAGIVGLILKWCFAKRTIPSRHSVVDTEVRCPPPSLRTVLLPSCGKCGWQTASNNGRNLLQSLPHLQRDASVRTHLPRAAHIRGRLGHFSWIWDALLVTFIPKLPTHLAQALWCLQYISASPSAQSYMCLFPLTCVEHS